jgi:type IV secretory pathway VirD2 relaxase
MANTDDSGPGFRALRRLGPPRADGKTWLKGLGRTIVKRQARMTRTGGGARKEPKQSALKVYQRRSIVKVSYRRSNRQPRWAAHARYLTREHAQTEHERGVGFDADHDRVNMERIVDSWQRDSTPLMWSVIISPDDCDRIDLRQHLRELVAGMEQDLGTRLEWTAIDHHPPTGNDHVHLLIRGTRDDGKELSLDRDYVMRGIRELSQSIIERDLGPRSEYDMLVARERGIQGNHWTDIDKTLQFRKDTDGIVAYQGTPWTQEARDRMRQEVERLVHLEKLGLAKCIGESTWQLSPHHESKLREMQRENDIQKQRSRQKQHELEREHG